MSWYLTQSVYAIADDPGNKRRLYRTDVYLNWTQYQMYSGGYAAHGGGSVDGQGFGWDGPSSGGSTSAGSQVINTSDFWIYGDTNGYHGTVYADSWFDGGGGYAPGYISASASTGGFDYDLKPGTPSSVTATVNADKTITVNVAAVSSPAGTATYHVQYSMEGGGYTGEQTSTSTSIVFSGLTKGKNYVFRAWATNSDGTGGTTTSASVFLPSGGRIYNGTAWVPTATARIYNGTAWVPIVTARIYDGTNWVNLA